MITHARTRSTLARAALALGALTLAIGGCGGTRTVKGIVLDAPISRAVVVDARDERLTQQGVPGVEIKLMHPGTETRGGIAPIATTVSDDTGVFTLSFPVSEKVRQAVVLADGDAVFRSTTKVYVPNTGQQLVVNVRTTGARASAPTDDPGAP